MSFTDEDLKRLKADIYVEFSQMSTEELRALLARLEAAEKVVEFGEHKHDHCIDRGVPCDCGKQALEEAWRNEAGK